MEEESRQADGVEQVMALREIARLVHADVQEVQRRIIRMERVGSLETQRNIQT